MVFKLLWINTFSGKIKKVQGLNEYGDFRSLYIYMVIQITHSILIKLYAF